MKLEIGWINFGMKGSSLVRGWAARSYFYKWYFKLSVIPCGLNLIIKFNTPWSWAIFFDIYTKN